MLHVQAAVSQYSHLFITIQTLVKNLNASFGGMRWQADFSMRQSADDDIP